MCLQFYYVIAHSKVDELENLIGKDSCYMPVRAGPPNARKRRPGYTPGQTGTALSTH